jgi:hypothetical protein
MKSLLLPTAILFASLTTLASAQGLRPRQQKAPETNENILPNPAAVLSDSQASSVLDQLQVLEKQVMQMRGSALTVIMGKLRGAMGSDQAALNFYLECDRLVNSVRKERDKTEARKRQEDIEKRIEQRGKNADQQEEGDFGLAVKLGIQYLVLTLEAHEAKGEDLKKMVPKLQEYIQSVVDAAPKLKGRASFYLANSMSPNNSIVSALSLSGYLNGGGWSHSPLDIGSMFTQTLFPMAEEANKDSLPALWDARILAEGTFKKDNLFGPEFELWSRNELPTMRWQRAQHLYQKGSSPVNALADMLKVIKENPGHANAPTWVEGLRALVNHSATSQTSANTTPSPGS